MKKFLINTTLFLFLCAILCFFVLTRANGYTDAFYERLTTPLQSSLIIGTSRSAQGIMPEVLNRELGRKDIYNYSFTLYNSPYGPVYLKSIDQKLSKKTKNGIFILAVDPWCISSTGLDPNDESLYAEKDLFLADLNSVTSKPNLEYLIKHYDKNYYKLLYKTKDRTFLHEDGWLEVNVDIGNTNMINSRIESKMRQYRKKVLPTFKFSENRFKYLQYTIEKLKAHGKVYLVRLPVHDKMMEIENIYMPDFDSKMKVLSGAMAVPLLNLTPLNSSFLYTDGNHLYKDSSREVTKFIAEWIKKEDR